LNTTVAEPLGDISTGPCGLGGKHCPKSRKVYSPACGLLTVRMSLQLPSSEGSNATSKEISSPSILVTTII
jgi:hypothetical protein